MVVVFGSDGAAPTIVDSGDGAVVRAIVIVMVVVMGR